MLLNRNNTLLVMVLNALGLTIAAVVKYLNINQIVIAEVFYNALTYLSEICLILTLIYLLIAFRHFDYKKRYVGFIVYIVLTLTLFVFLPGMIRLINVAWVVAAMSSISLLLLVDVCYLAIISLKLSFRPLAQSYCILFSSLILIQIVTMVAPLILVYIGKPVKSYFIYMDVLLALPAVIRFLVLYNINLALNSTPATT